MFTEIISKLLGGEIQYRAVDVYRPPMFRKLNHPFAISDVSERMKTVLGMFDKKFETTRYYFNKRYHDWIYYSNQLEFR